MTPSIGGNQKRVDRSKASPGGGDRPQTVFSVVIVDAIFAPILPKLHQPMFLAEAWMEWVSNLKYLFGIVPIECS